MNNAGIHAAIHFFRTQYGGKRNPFYYYDPLFENNSRLAGLTAVGDRNMLGFILGAKQPGHAPDMVVVGRLTAHEQTIKDLWGKDPNPEKLAQDWADAVNADLSLSPDDDASRFIYWQPIDETKEHYDWHARFDIAAMKAMKEHGRRYAALNLFTGCPRQPPFDTVNEWDQLWPVIQEAHKLTPQWVTLQTHCYIDTAQPLTPQGQQYHALRPFYLLDRSRAEGLKIQLVIGETGTYEPFSRSGVRDYNQLAEILSWMWEQYQRYPEVKSINTYTCDTNGVDGNDAWLVPPEVVLATRSYNLGHADRGPAPQPQPSPAPPPPWVPPQTAGTYQVKTDGRNLLVRTGPGMEYAYTGSFTDGTMPVEVEGITNGWAKLVGQDWYLSANYLKRVV